MDRKLFLQMGEEKGFNLNYLENFITPTTLEETRIMLENITPYITPIPICKYLSDYYIRIGNGEVHENYDCSEITDDFLIFANSSGSRGCRLNITPNNGWMNMFSRGTLIKFEYHDVCLLRGKVLDPEFSEHPVPLEEYMGRLKELNPETELILTITED